MTTQAGTGQTGNLGRTMGPQMSEKGTGKRTRRVVESIHALFGGIGVVQLP